MSKTRLKLFLGFILTSFLVLQFISPSFGQTTNDLNNIINHPLRSEQDRNLDSKRMPLQMLQFIGPKPGMKVLDIFSGGGHTAQLLGLSVAPNGKVFAFNLKPNERLMGRVQGQPQSNIVPIVLAIEDLSNEPNGSFDLITIINSYHDMVNAKPEIEVVNRRIYDLLKPGGILVVRDHAAKDSAGKSATRTLHRIDPAAVDEDFQKVGFKKVAQGDFLKSPQDTKEKHSNQMGDTLAEDFIFRWVK
jgi:predicted methyltransferase